MTALGELAGAVRDCIVVAWVDARTGEVVEQHVARSGPEVEPALDAAIEVMRSRARPQRMVLLSARHVHIVQRLASERRRVLVVICDRTPNIGFAVALVRAFVDAEAA
ncbi:MAG TPA: hypothetical protein VHW23_46975 [Kofleriaceae bacterium]|jgi:hypothetical protein|nr:hypothetical protein [Kofleriaceae bacterium]